MNYSYFNPTVLKPRKFSLKSFPKNFACADTETDETGRATIFGICGNNRKGQYIQHVFTETNFLLMKEKVNNILREFSTIYFHNLEFDLNAMFERNWVKDYDIIYRMSGALIAKIDYGSKRKSKLIDSVALLPASLAKIGKMVGLEKLTVSNFQDEDYCLRDCQVLFKAINYVFDIMKENEIPFGYTLPAIFVNFFQTHLNTNIERLSLPELKFIRKAYKGGRNEVYTMGKVNNVKVYDINSLYPYAMANIKLAIPGKYKRTTILKSSDECFQILACKVKINADVKIPVLCIKKNNKLIFPNGSFVGYFTNLELETMLSEKQGSIIEVYSGMQFEYYKTNLLTESVLHLYSLRQQALTPFENYLFKIILNGGYGKFGQWIWQTRYNESEDVLERYETEELKAYANQLWAVQITSYARNYLFQFLNEYQNEVVYTDTDSLHLTCDLRPELLNPIELGMWKEENAGEAEYKACKMYRIDNDYKVKGVPKKRQKWAFKNNAIYYTKPVRIKSALRFDLKPNIWQGILKHFESNYDKRVIMSDNSTTPLTLNTEFKECLNQS